MARISFAFTICETAEAEKIAAKRITPARTIPYDRPTWWRFEPAIETSHEAMAERLRALALQPQRMIVMGAPAARLDLRQAHRRIWADARTATLSGPDRAWLPLDFDDAVVPEGLGRGERLVEASMFVRDRLLPPEFHGARMIAVPTASTGRKGDEVARLRLFVALASAHPLTAMKAWAKGAAAALELSIDSSVVQEGQPIYSARPVFEDVSDPVPRALHATILEGERELVQLEVNRFAPKLAAIQAKLDRAVCACGSNWRALMDATVGDDDGFFVPLTRSIGVAVLAGAASDDIQAVVAALLAGRADAGRQRQYGPAWVQQAIESFRRRDAVTRAAHQRALSNLFINGRTSWI